MSIEDIQIISEEKGRYRLRVPAESKADVAGKVDVWLSARDEALIDLTVCASKKGAYCVEENAVLYYDTELSVASVAVKTRELDPEAL